MLPKLFVLSVMFLVLYRHLKSFFLNYHVLNSLFHHLFFLFCALLLACDNNNNNYQATEFLAWGGDQVSRTLRRFGWMVNFPRVLIDGLGYLYAFTRGLPLVTVVHSMRESVHAIRCDFLSPQGIYTRASGSGRGHPSANMQLAFSLVSRHISRTQSFQENRPFLFHARGIANRPPRTL